MPGCSVCGAKTGRSKLEFNGARRLAPPALGLCRAPSAQPPSRTAPACPRAGAVFLDRLIRGISFPDLNGGNDALRERRRQARTTRLFNQTLSSDILKRICD